MSLVGDAKKVLLGEAVSSKITRNAFLYMEPSGDHDEFAQCGSCENFSPESKSCKWFTKEDPVDGDDSCGLYAFGTPHEQESLGTVTKEEAGFVQRRVQCHRCRFGGQPKCRLYMMLNRMAPQNFDLNEKIKKNACCNAFKES